MSFFALPETDFLLFGGRDGRESSGRVASAPCNLIGGWTPVSSEKEQAANGYSNSAACLNT